MSFAEISSNLLNAKSQASYEKEAYFHRNYKARCILDFHNKKDGGGGGLS